MMPQPRAHNFGTALLTANMLAKMTVTYEMNVRRDEIVVFSLFDSLMKGPMPQTQEDLTAVLSVETDKEKLVDHLASSYIYDKIVKEPGLHTRIVTIQLNYQFLYSTPSLLPQWDVIYATATTLLGGLSRQREASRAPAMGPSSSMLVTNYKPPRLSDKQHDSQIYLTLVALESSVERLDISQMTTITSEHAELSVHWNSTVMRNHRSTHPLTDQDLILTFLSKVTVFYDPSSKHDKIETHLLRMQQWTNESPRKYLSRFQKILAKLEDSAIIAKVEDEHIILSSVQEQVKVATKGFTEDFRQTLKVHRHATKMGKFASWGEFYQFIAELGRAVYSDSEPDGDELGAAGDNKNKKPSKLRSIRQLSVNTDPQGQRSPAQVFPKDGFSETMGWPEDKTRCVFDFNRIPCKFGKGCRRTHLNPTESDQHSTAATSATIRRLDVQIRKLKKEKEQLGNADSSECETIEPSSEDGDPHKAPPLPPCSLRSSSRN